METDPITTEQLDPTAVKVNIPGVGELVIMRYTADDGTQGARILETLETNAAPTTVEPG